jgi:hypothetical protein
MTIKRISEGAFYVPIYYQKNVESCAPGLINQPIANEECEYDDELFNPEEINEKESDKKELEKIINT